MKSCSWLFSKHRSPKISAKAEKERQTNPVKRTGLQQLEQICEWCKQTKQERALPTADSVRNQQPRYSRKLLFFFIGALLDQPAT